MHEQSDEQTAEQAQGREDDGWSAVADEWSASWGAVAAPARRALVTAARIGPGTRVLDVGCGSGEFLAELGALGAVPLGADPSPRMVELARRTGAEVRVAAAERLPWPDASVDVCVLVNALPFTDDPLDALRECARVVVPGGVVALANWAEGARNDLDVLERAIARAVDEEPTPDGELRTAGGLEALVAEAGLALVDAGLVAVEWAVADASALARGVLLGEDDDTIAELAPTVVAAAAPFRRADGSYRLAGAFRWAVARTRAQ